MLTDLPVLKSSLFRSEDSSLMRGDQSQFEDKYKRFHSVAMLVITRPSVDKGPKGLIDLQNI